MAPDRVHCHGLKLRVRIGFHDYERRIEQAVLVDLTMETNFRVGPERDLREGLIDYYELTRHLEKHVDGKAYDLVEALAVDLAREVIAQSAAEKVKVRLTKTPLDMPMVEHIWVECERSRADFEQEEKAE